MKYALIDALATAVYVAVVASFMYLAGQGMIGTSKSVLIPIAMLMLFVFSAALTGTMMFGRPIMWYLDGKKKDALKLLVHTLGIFMLITFVVLILLIWIAAG